MALTAEQFTQLLAALPGIVAGGGQGGGQLALGAASAVGPMGHCNLGIDKSGRLKRFNDWMKGAQAKIDFMGLSTDKQKISLLRSWEGPRVEAAGNRLEIPAQSAHTYQGYQTGDFLTCQL